MKKHKLIPILAAALLLTGCAGRNKNPGPEPQLKDEYKVVNLMDAYKPESVPDAEPDAAFRESQMAFALSLFQKEAEHSDRNVLLSPFSITQALGMTELGAAGETLSQMQDVLSGGMPVEEYSRMLSAYLHSTEGNQLVSANSIWFHDKDTLTVQPEFLQRNADYFGADAFRTDFWATDCNNRIAIVQMNNWVYQNTNARIPRMLEQISPDAVMVLLNAVTFDAEWRRPYNGSTTHSIFTDVHGTEQTAEMMHSEEFYYITDGQATGFLKDYADGQFCFAALLPMEGLAIGDYIAGMDAGVLLQTLQNPEKVTVFASMPKFSAAYDTQLHEPLRSLGMTDAFDAEAADFSEMAHSEDGTLFIGEVLHKATITVDTQGTTAAAATAVVVADGEAVIEEIREVHLDRPFVYMILDKEQMLPVFIGVVNELETPSEE